MKMKTNISKERIVKSTGTISFWRGCAKKEGIGEKRVVLKEKPILEPIQHDHSKATRVLERSTMKKANNERQSMKQKIGVMIAIGMALGISSAVAQTGNGALSGPHYNLNIIGTDHCPGDDLVGTQRHVIFVELFGGEEAPGGKSPSDITPQNKIYLTEGDTFEVLDGNACDGRAEFQLPAGGYWIFIRPLGQPGGSATITLCATDTMGTEDTSDDVIVCSSGNVILTRDKGQAKFTNVTDELTTVVLADGTEVSLFDPALQDYFWNYDNNGLRLAQLRFYPIPE